MTYENGPKPLAGLRILDFGHTIMGPCAGLVFADLGAEVIKIEPATGDPTRRLPGFAAGFFATFGRNKKSIAVDLKTQEGQAIVHRLVKDADVVLENFGPGVMERLNCGWEDLRECNPRLVYLALKGYLKGPYENRGALDEVVQMQSGLAYMTGPRGRPLRAGASVVDILGGVFGVVAVLAALRERDHTGLGQRVASSLYESSVFLVGSMIAGSAVTGQPMPPMPERKGAWGIYDVFVASGEAQIFVGVTSDAHWHRFCKAFARADLAANDALATNAGRCDARDWLIPDLAAMLSRLRADDVLAKCEAANIPCARVGRPDELEADPHLVASGGLLQTAMAGLGGGDLFAGLPALPVEFGDERNRLGLEAQPPRIGEHTIELLRSAGLDDEEIADLRQRNIVAAVQA